MRARMPDPGSHQGGKENAGISRMSKGVCWAWEIRDDWTAKLDPVGREHELTDDFMLCHVDGVGYRQHLCKRCEIFVIVLDDRE